MTGDVSEIRKALLRWIDGGLRFEPDSSRWPLETLGLRQVAESVWYEYVIDGLRECTANLPDAYCDRLGIDRGSTYEQAVRKIWRERFAGKELPARRHRAEGCPVEVRPSDQHRHNRAQERRKDVGRLAGRMPPLGRGRWPDTRKQAAGRRKGPRTTTMREARDTATSACLLVESTAEADHSRGAEWIRDVEAIPEVHRVYRVLGQYDLLVTTEPSANPLRLASEILENECVGRLAILCGPLDIG